MKDFSYVYNAHPEYIDQMYKKYLTSPSSVDEGWRTFFEGFDFASRYSNGQASSSPVSSSEMDKEFGAMSIIHGFRDREVTFCPLPILFVPGGIGGPTLIFLIII